MRLFEKEGDFVDLALVVLTLGQVVEGGIVAADDLVFRCLAANLVVADAESHHVHAHVGGRLVWILAVDAVEKGVQHREYLNVAVVVDGSLAVGLQMEGVNHVHIVEVGGGGLVGDVDGMFQRKAPHRECLELGIACLDTALVLVVELAETHGHLAAAGAGGGDDDQGAAGLDVVVLAETLVGVNQGHIGRIAVDCVVAVGLDAKPFEALAESNGAALAVIVGYHHRAHHESPVLELAAKAQDILVVGYAEVVADFVFLDVDRADYNDDFCLVAQLLEHPQLAVGLESGQNAAGMVVVEKFSSELKVELVSELGYALLDVFGLNFEIFLVIKTVFHNGLQIYSFFPVRASSVPVFFTRSGHYFRWINTEAVFYPFLSPLCHNF